MFVFDGKKYKSKRACLLEYNIPENSVYVHAKRNGISFEDALFEMLKRKFTAFGKEYRSYRDLCNDNKITYITFKKYFDKTGDIEESITLAKNSSVSKGFVYHGTYIDSISMAERIYELYPGTLSLRCRRTGETPEDALDKILENKEKGTYEKQEVTVFGKTYESIRKACKANDISETYIYIKIHNCKKKGQTDKGKIIEDYITRKRERNL